MTDTPAAAGTLVERLRKSVQAINAADNRAEFRVLSGETQAAIRRVFEVSVEAADELSACQAELAAADRRFDEERVYGQERATDLHKKFAEMRDWYEAKLNALMDPLIQMKMLEPPPPIIMDRQLLARAEESERLLLECHQELNAAQIIAATETEIAERSERLLAARDMDAEAFQYLQNAPIVEAQAFFWNVASRSQRRKAILQAALAGKEPTK